MRQQLPEHIRRHALKFGAALLTAGLLPPAHAADLLATAKARGTSGSTPRSTTA